MNRTETRSAAGPAWLILVATLACMAASALLWWLFAGRTQYEGFQDLVPVAAWLLVMLLHAWLGTLVLLASREQPGSPVSVIAVGYFLLALVLNVGIALDYSNTDEQLYRWAQDRLAPQDRDLHLALEAEPPDLAAIRVLLTGGADADAWRGTWAIWKAVRRRHWAIARELLAAGANPNRLSRSGTRHDALVYQVDGPLERLLLRRDQRRHLLCDLLQERGDPLQRRATDALAKAVIAGGLEPMPCGEGIGAHSMVLEAMRQQDPLALLLLREQAGLQLPPAEADAALEVLRSTAALGDLALATELLHWLPVTTYPAGYTRALDTAVRRGRVTYVEEMLAAGAKPGPTSLATAIRQMDKPAELAGKLLAAGADPDAVGERGELPLTLALAQMDIALLGQLLDAGVNLEHEALEDDPLHTVISSRDERRFALAERLLQHDADLQAYNRDFHTPLMAATRRNDVQMVTLLMDYGADPDFVTWRGETARQIADGKPHAVALRALFARP